MTVEIVPAGEDLVAATAEALPRGEELAQSLVVFPGERPGHFLRRELARRIGGPFSPPRILTMNALVDERFEDWHEGRLPLAQSIDAVAVLHDIQRQSGAAIGGDAFAALDAFFTLGTRIFDALEELTLEGISTERLAGVQALVEGGLPARSRDRLATMARFHERFYPAIRAKGLSTRAMRYREVADRLEPESLAGFRRVVVSGFLELAEAERRIVGTIASLPQALLLFHEGRGLEPELERLGIGGRAGAPPAAPRPAVSFTSSPDAHGQAFALAKALGEPSADTVVVLPAADSLFPLERYCLSRLDRGDYNISLGYPITRTPLYGFLGNLAELATATDGDRLYVPHYLTFILHPYAKNVLLGNRTEPARVVMHEIERRLSSRRTRTFVTLEEIERDAALFEEAAARLAPETPGVSAADLAALLVQLHDATIRRFRSFSSAADFADRCLALVEWVHDRTTARRHPHFLPFAEQMVEALESIRRSLLADRTFEGPAGYFALLRRYLASCRVPFPGTPLHGLQVLGSMETRCLRFRRVFVLDANEGALPTTGRDDGLLSLGVREALGLSTWRDRERRERYRFEELAAGARELHLLYVDDGAAEPSRFVEQLAWEEERAGRPPTMQRVRYGVSLSSRPPVPIAKSPEVLEWLARIPLSPSGLDDWLACPLSFYYRRVLGLEERQEVTGDIEPLDIGSFVHRVLAEYLTPLRGTPLEPGALDPAVAARLVAARFPQAFGAADAGRARLLERQLARRLSDFVARWLAPLAGRERLVVLEVERRVTREAGGLPLTGTIDAVLERDGVPCILDFKTGYDDRRYRPRLGALDIGDRSSWLEGVRSVQLPCYLLLYGAETGREPPSMDARFLLLGKSAMDDRIEVPLFTDREEAAAEWPRVAEVVRRLAAEVLDPAVPFSPTAEPELRCPRCPYRTACCGPEPEV